MNRTPRRRGTSPYTPNPRHDPDRPAVLELRHFRRTGETPLTARSGLCWAPDDRTVLHLKHPQGMCLRCDHDTAAISVWAAQVRSPRICSTCADDADVRTLDLALKLVLGVNAIRAGDHR